MNMKMQVLAVPLGETGISAYANGSASLPANGLAAIPDKVRRMNWRLVNIDTETQ
jgi:hypothetical protein